VGQDRQSDVLEKTTVQTASTSPDDFSLEEDSEMDLDSPTEGFSSIPDAIRDIQQGKVCCLLDIQ
jgi:3,4-dihydroxy 2-butanone 4-phosphate synthase / GTP cyclohydrolase II